MVLNPEEILFVGAAQSQAPTLHKLAMDTLDMSWPNWRNREKPECCIIPPIFSYTHPEKSDQRINDCGKKNQMTSRRSEWAEHIVYKAVWALSQRKLQAPILVVHSLDLDRIRHHLPHIFPNVQINQNNLFLREYDFVLIGPQIGLVVIEVKSSEFSAPSDFKPNTRLPKDYSDGIKQLQYFAENFLNFLQDCTGINWPEGSPVRRILFMPNLEKARHENWRQSLGKQYQKAEPGSFDNSDAHTIKWYKEDLDNGEKELEALTTISKLLDGEPGHKISGEIYEAYASLIAGLGSVIVFKNQSNTKLDPLKIFEGPALLREAERIETQDGSGPLKKGKAKVEALKHFSKVIMPTRQQLEALNGPNRQFIVGPAGCGKTVVLQEKALQLLRNGLKVLIGAPESYISRYKDLFDSNCLNSYEVHPLQTIREEVPNLAHKIILGCYENGLDPVEAISKHLKRSENENSAEWINLQKKLKFWMENFDAILIDDAIDEVGDLDYVSKIRGGYDQWRFLTIKLTIMAYSDFKFPHTTLWIALDPLTYYGVDYACQRRFVWLFGHVFEKNRGQKWSSIVLDKVMRSSENIFRVVYEDEIKALSELRISPSIGHKIVGPEVTRKRQHLCYGIDMASTWHRYHFCYGIGQVLWARIKPELDKLLAQKVPLGFISIVLGGTTCYRYFIIRFLIDQLRGCGIPVTSSYGGYRNKNIGESYQQDGIPWNIHGSGGDLSINYWDKVSSLEWPVVIYTEAAMKDLFYNKNVLMLQRYRGCSRATTKLIEIITFYGPEDLDQAINRATSDSKKGTLPSCIRKKLHWLQFWKRRERH